MRFVTSHTWNIVTAPTRPARMARRARWGAAYRFSSVGQVHVPVLVITGEDRLDRVVQPGLTREFVRLMPGADAVTLPRTGHLGLVTRPEAFAGLIVDFVNSKVNSAGGAEGHGGGRGVKAS